LPADDFDYWISRTAAAVEVGEDTHVIDNVIKIPEWISGGC
jgi:hypothetical protein